MTDKQLLQELPTPPNEYYHYDIVHVSDRVIRVDLVHTYPYDYACGKPVFTVWGFIKGGRVYPAKSIKQMHPKSVCAVEQAGTQSGYTCVIPKCTSLLHIK